MDSHRGDHAVNHLGPVSMLCSLPVLIISLALSPAFSSPSPSTLELKLDSACFTSASLRSS